MQGPLDRLQALNPTPIPNQHNQEISDWVVNALSSAGIRDYFGIPGGAVEPLLNAIARTQLDNINIFTCKHEGSAGFMADGYYKESGRIAACFATSGPGATNLITGISSAYVDAIPMLVITGQSGIRNFGKGALQDSSCAGVDLVSMLKHCTRFSSLISHADQLPQKISKAINILYSDNPGPVHLSIPVNIFREPEQLSIEACLAANNVVIRANQVSESLPNLVVQELRQANERVTVLLGERAGTITEKLLKLSSHLNWRIVTTPRSKGLIESAFNNNHGVLGLGGHASAIDALSHTQSDLILVIGATLDECSTANWDINGVYSDRVIHVDSNPSQLDYFSFAKFKFQCDLKLFADYLDSQLMPLSTSFPASTSTSTSTSTSISSTSFSTPIKTQAPPPASPPQSSRSDYAASMGAITLDLTRSIDPKFLIQHVSRNVPKNTRVYADSGNAYIWAIHYWHCKKPDRGINPFQIGLGFSSMGWAIGASLGASVANQNKNGIICITGDGSTLMHAGELATAAQHHLPILYIILNDSSYGTVKHGQRLAGAEQVAFELPAIHFAQLAEEMGILSYRLSSYDELLKLNFADLLSQDRPVLLDVLIDPEAVPPMQDRMQSLGTAKKGTEE